MSSTTDLTCATLLIYKNDKKYVLQQYFLAKERMDFKLKDDKIPYNEWEKRGLLTICEGAKIDYSDVTKWFVKMIEDYEIAPICIGYDPWNSNYWIDEMKGIRISNVRS